ncbi:MAG TPA: hypothetical protein PLQ35_07930 [bacterium]|nr:hypothetical protein [bacterium]HQL62208.1 hypothetical protein [bacterium]
MNREDWKTKWKRFTSKVRSVLHEDAFLCDTCKWNYGSICARPERPNATICPEYVSKSV